MLSGGAPVEKFGGLAQVGDKVAILARLVVMILNAQQSDGWMVTKAAVPSASCSALPRIFVMVTGRPSRLRAAVAPKATIADGFTIVPLDFEPDPAALDFVTVWPLVQAPFAAHLMLEMFDRVGDEHFLARNTRLCQCLVKDTPRWTDERLAGKVFLVAGLLANQHQMRMAAAFAGHRLGCILIQRAAACTRARPARVPAAS